MKVVVKKFSSMQKSGYDWVAVFRNKDGKLLIYYPARKGFALSKKLATQQVHAIAEQNGFKLVQADYAPIYKWYDGYMDHSNPYILDDLQEKYPKAELVAINLKDIKL